MMEPSGTLCHRHNILAASKEERQCPMCLSQMEACLVASSPQLWITSREEEACEINPLVSTHTPFSLTHTQTHTHLI